ncbi:5-formyltetrahydrofolate cyclo-ligase [Caldichromatium japonicum]|uniref:5-formyltetrahydrofolate cyclo-ligase n=1 Tax=Caldichromatium japonicum TaxID=2699430 RepID=A0A6G7VAS5_9GAMM|nr:5-formyltetrahydrofolate cyclo-ligase [Caldichromatium japonicum]QIK36887.1 5-formyltetrahydrofolate cyclo-ligase [Caldichromatium japonicum]
MQNSSQLRQVLRTARRALSPSLQRLHARRLARHLGKHPFFLRARRLALYWPADGEIDPRPVLDRPHARAKHVYLPVLNPLGRSKSLWFARYRPDGPLRFNRFGIPEPHQCGRQLIPIRHLDLIILPLVGFDAHGNRLGMGGGFYDRTLAYRRRYTHWQRPRLVGVAHECQRVEHIEAKPWDIRLDMILTEAGCYLP